MINNIEPTELAIALAAGDWCIVDVREDWEIDVVSLDDTLNIPLGELVARVAEIPKDRQIATLCHSGMRSAQAATFLQNSGYDQVYNIAGGIDRWATDVDTGLARY